MTRKMATIRQIAEVKSIPDADKIVAYRVDGWWVVDQKDKYQVGDLVVYVEPDAWVPNNIAPFLSKGKEPREFNGIKGEKLRTIKLKKQLSQGLILDLSVLGQPHEIFSVSEGCIGADVSSDLCIQKYEPPIPAQLRGQVRGNFPALIPKTDAERIQNVSNWDRIQYDEYEVTEKLHGTSATFYLDTEGEFHVCSRNLDLKFEENNTYWKTAIQYDIEKKLRQAEAFGCAIQGEIIGQGINGNQYGLPSTELYVFNVYSVQLGSYFPSRIRKQFVEEELGLQHVPVLNVQTKGKTVQEILQEADGKSLINGSDREGFVLKSMTKPDVIIKVISNKWLLDGGDEK